MDIIPDWLDMQSADMMMVIGVLLLEGFTLLLCVKIYKIDKEHGIRNGVLLFSLVHLMGLGLAFVGKELGQRDSLVRNPMKFFIQGRSAESPTFKMVGDPGLLGYATHGTAKNVRPQFDSAKEFSNWQRSKRRLLQDIFEFQELSNQSKFVVKHQDSKSVVGSITRVFITMESFDGTSIPGYILLPQKKLPVPGILVLSGHVTEGEEGILQTAGHVPSYQHRVGLELANAGYVVLTIEFRGFGKLGEPPLPEHRLVAYNAMLGGSFYKAILSRDIFAALGYLRTREEVDPDRIGITGVSYGGEMAITYAALDPRVKVVVMQGYGGGVGLLPGIKGTKVDQPHYCHFIPGFQQSFFQEDLALLVAPRPLLGVRGTEEGVFEKKEFYEVVSQAYKVLNAPSVFQMKEMEGTHEYFVQPAVEFFNRYL